MPYHILLVTGLLLSNYILLLSAAAIWKRTWRMAKFPWPVVVASWAFFISAGFYLW